MDASPGGDAVTDDADGVCMPGVAPARRPPLDMYVVFDRTASMQDAVAGGTKLSSAVAAINAFAMQPTENDVAMGLAFFGKPQPITCPVICADDTACGAGCGPCNLVGTGIGTCAGANNVVCEASAYADPDVELMAIPDAAPVLATALAMVAPDGSTATTLAIEGAFAYLSAWAQAHLDRVPTIVLLTDDGPNACGDTLEMLTAAVAAGLGAEPNMLTHVVTYTQDGTLEPVAIAGGTALPYEIPSGGDPAATVFAALEEITRRSRACTYAAPAATAAVELLYTPPGASDPTEIPNVADRGACTVDGGWYSLAGRSQLQLCPATCDTVELTPGGTLELRSQC